MVFTYWLRNLITGEEDMITDTVFYDIGTTLTIAGTSYIVTDFAMESLISCEELAEEVKY